MTSFSSVQGIIKQLLNSVFAISRIIKVSVRVINLHLDYILDITKTSSNNCLLFMYFGCIKLSFELSRGGAFSGDKKQAKQPKESAGLRRGFHLCRK